MAPQQKSLGTLPFLPLSPLEMKERGWTELDFIMISGDAYVDHPSFGAALISRLLESRGYRVGLICQPDWKNPEAFQVLGKPRLAFLVTGGNMDTMVLHYSTALKKRREDWYTPGRAMGRRPDRATIVYCAALRQVFKKTPIIIGGIETSLRRLGHYDYWSGKVRRSILLDAKADLAVFGMGERAILEIAQRLSEGEPIETLTDIRGTLYRTLTEPPEQTLPLPDFETIVADKTQYAASFRLQMLNTEAFSARPLSEAYPRGETIVQNPPALPLDGEFLDEIYELPYLRTWHPTYDQAGGIPAIQEVKFGLVSSRGCFGACSFCALTFHQGKVIQARSHESLLREAKLLIQDADFKGYIHDVGGPTANFRQCACDKMEKKGGCPEKGCLAPDPCKNLKPDHSDYLELLRKLRALPGIKKVFIRSGVRFDYLMMDPDQSFFQEMVEHHISGQLKVAPEHVSDQVLRLMGKPSHQVFLQFKERYNHFNLKAGKKQFLVPYFISSHPGSTLQDAIKIAEYLRDTGFIPEQVQDFYPTPGTLSTCMYYTGLDPRNGQAVHIPSSMKEKALQRALLQYRLPQNQSLVAEALKQAGREDLIGHGKLCLIRPLSGPRSSKPGQQFPTRGSKQPKSAKQSHNRGSKGS